MAAETNYHDLHRSAVFSSGEFPAVRLCQLGGCEKITRTVEQSGISDQPRRHGFPPVDRCEN